MRMEGCWRIANPYLQSRRIANPYIPSRRIANPPERGQRWFERKRSNRFFRGRDAHVPRGMENESPLSARRASLPLVGEGDY